MPCLPKVENEILRGEVAGLRDSEWLRTQNWVSASKVCVKEKGGQLRRTSQTQSFARSCTALEVERVFHFERVRGKKIKRRMKFPNM